MVGSVRRPPVVVRSDEGLGLVEVVISVLLVCLVAVAVFPLLASSVRTSGRNATIATASQFASLDQESARSSATSCAGLRGYIASAAPTTRDASGQTYTIARSSVTCPSSYPALVTYTSSVLVSGATVASVTTKFLVTS